MAKIDDISGLIRAIGDRDYTKAKQCVMVMIANERAAGREKAAMLMERSLRSWGEGNSKLVELPHNIKHMLYSPETLKSLSEIYIDYTVRGAVEGFLHERQSADVLRDAGLTVRNRILLAGPPGNGKTTLAGAIANELNLPIYVVNLSELVGSFLGETSGRLGKIMEYARLNQCIVLLDEFDAIGQQRETGSGSQREYTLIVTTLLTSLDRLPDTAIIIGATNMPELIDPALERRFNLKLWLDSPGICAINTYVSAYMDKNAVCFDTSNLTGLTGQPWSRVEEYCLEQHRNILLGQCISGSGWIGRGA